MNENLTEKELAEKDFKDYANNKKFLPCQFLPPSFFMHRVWIWSSVSDVNDTYAAADACNSCPLKKQCNILGKDEACGIWGGESRWYWTRYRDVSSGDYPYA